MSVDPDSLLHAIARTCKTASSEGDALSWLADERWDRFTAGQLSAAEEAELGVWAQAADRGGALAAFRPLGPEFVTRVVAAVRAQQQLTKAAPSATAQERPGKVLSFPRRTAKFAGWLAAAAALFLVVILGRDPGNFLGKNVAPLPAYAWQLSGQVQDVRGVPSAPTPLAPTFAPGGRFELVLRPQTALLGEIAVQTFWSQGDDLRSLALPVETSASGAIRIAGTVGQEIDLPPGSSTLWVVIGRPGKLPAAQALRDLQVASETDELPPQWTLITVPFTLQAP